MNGAWRQAEMLELLRPARSFRHDSRHPINATVAFQVDDREGQLLIKITNLKALFPTEITSAVHCYRAWLLNREQNYLVATGIFNSDGNGEATSFFEFVPNDVLESGLSISQFDFVAITAETHDSVISPDHGAFILFGELPSLDVSSETMSAPESENDDVRGRCRSRRQDNFVPIERPRTDEQEADEQTWAECPDGDKDEDFYENDWPLPSVERRVRRHTRLKPARRLIYADVEDDSEIS